MTKIDSRKFGLLVRGKLAALDLSQKQLAIKIKKSNSSVSELLNGKDGFTVSNSRVSEYANAINQLSISTNSTILISIIEIKACEVDYREDKKIQFLTALDDRYYQYSDGRVNALRLWGSSYQSVSENSIRINYVEDPIVPFVHFRKGYSEFIYEKSRQFQLRGVEFFNGPCVRLINFRVSPEDGPDAASEAPVMTLHFGPVSWYEYSFLRDEYEHLGDISSFDSPRARMIGLEELLRSGTIDGSRTSNIVDTVTTIVSNDGFVGYQQRSGTVAASPTFFTSSVAENMNRWKDECELTSHTNLLDPMRHYTHGITPADSNYQPSGVPNPFWTVRRGIDAELANKLSRLIKPNALRLFGLSFDLVAGHPDLLFIALIDLPKDEIVKYCRENRGIESGEGRLHFTPARFDSAETKNLLSSENWTAGGKASFVRCIEYIRSIMLLVDNDFRRAFNLAQSNQI